MQGIAANGLLFLVVINTAVLIIFALSFAALRVRFDWRSLGVLSAFIVALFVEMYGFPLTIYVLSSWLLGRYPGVDIFAYSAGQIWRTVLGTTYPVYVLGYIAVVGGFILVLVSWRTLYNAQRNRQVARAGSYSYVRHPQYVGFILIMLGVLLTWPALSTVIMFPILVTIYVRLARREERQTLAEFGDEYRRYMANTPAFLPGINRACRERQDEP